MASRSLADLHPAFLPHVERFLRECQQAGFQLLVTCTWRSNTEQEHLYEIGRSKPGRRVTNARAGQSKHNAMRDNHPAALAIDVVPLRCGKLVWGCGGNGIDNDPTDDDQDDLELWQRIGVIGESCGMEWAGRWTGTIREMPHFQYRGVVM